MDTAVRRITLEGKGWEFEAAPGTTVLAAAEQAGIRLPSSCRNGTCRTCLCQLRSGSVRYRIEWPGLSLDEKREGYILPCVALAETDLVLIAPAAKKTA
ncbi:MAG: 2Fe-2S iron-sulfur cluster binding domain-containing protein [Pseudomonadota bacterium]